MFKHFAKITLRTIARGKNISIINILGLGLGLACTIFIFLWVVDELQFDRYHENIDQLYRIEQDQNYDGEIFHVSVTPYPVGPVYKDRIPEIKDAARIVAAHNMALFSDDQPYSGNQIGIVDPSLFTMFSYPLVKGSLKDFNDNPSAILLTETTAAKIFGDDDPIGRTLSLEQELDFTVVGVLEDIPKNSTYIYDAFMHFEITKKVGLYNESWGSNSIPTFVQLHPGASVEEVDKKLNEILKEFNPDTRATYMLFPYGDMHLHGYFGFTKDAGRMSTVYMFGLIGIFVLLIACMNFMNLTTAKSANRVKEIGVRRVVGVSRFGLIKQFLGEAVIMSFISLFLSILLVLLLLSSFNELTGKEITYERMFDPVIIIGVILITLFTGLFAGSYPAFFLSAFKPTGLFRGALRRGAKSSGFRRTLVVLQFSISIFLIIGTLVVLSQLDYMKNKDLGFDKHQLIEAKIPREMRDRSEVLHTALIDLPGVEKVTFSEQMAGRFGGNSGNIQWDGKSEELNPLVSFGLVSYDYLETMGITMKEGRGFSREYPGDTTDWYSTRTGNFVINEKLEKLMGVESAIGMQMSFLGVSGSVVGVTKDFHFTSLMNDIPPLAMLLTPVEPTFAIIRLAPNKIESTIDNIDEKWAQIFPNQPFDFSFTDENIDRMYRSFDRMSSILRYFAGFAIIIACLGLFGLVSFISEQRTKELGIRKTLGASTAGLTILLCKEFFWLVLISNIIAFPAAYYYTNDWLSGFAYRITISPMLFITAGLAALLLALGTVTFKAFKAARNNPVDSLRYE